MESGTQVNPPDPQTLNYLQQIPSSVYAVVLTYILSNSKLIPFLIEKYIDYRTLQNDVRDLKRSVTKFGSDLNAACDEIRDLGGFAVNRRVNSEKKVGATAPVSQD